jgi:hypothetical protein
MTKEEREDVVNKLVTLGEDSDELQYWLDVFEYLPPDAQAELAQNWKEELEELKNTEK